MPASLVVVLGGIHKAQLAILVGTNKLGCIDNTALQGGEDLTAGQQLDADTEFLIHLAGQTRDTHTQPLEVLYRFDGLAEPASHLHTGITTRQRLEAKRFIDLVPQFLTVTLVQPGIHGQRIHAEGYGCKILGSEGLAGPEVGIAPVHVHGALTYGVKTAKGRDQLTSCVELDLNAATGHGFHPLDKVGSTARTG